MEGNIELNFQDALALRFSKAESRQWQHDEQGQKSVESAQRPLSQSKRGLIVECGRQGTLDL